MATKKVAKKRGRPRKNAESAITEMALRAAVREAKAGVPQLPPQSIRYSRNWAAPSEQAGQKTTAEASQVRQVRYMPPAVSSIPGSNKIEPKPASPTVNGEIARLQSLINGLNDALGGLRDRISSVTEPFPAMPEPERPSLGCYTLDEISTQCERIAGLAHCVNALTNAIRL